MRDTRSPRSSDWRDAIRIGTEWYNTWESNSGGSPRLALRIWPPISLDRFRRWSERVHDAGGIVTINHIFGAIGGRKKPPSRTKVESTIAETIEGVLRLEAYGADLFEAGYLMRAGATLRDHLRVWDALLANGYSIYGDATADCHGGEWGEDMTPNPLATWIWAPDPGAASLLEAIRAGRLYFGNPFLWSGELSIRVDGGWMGDRIATSKPTAHLHVYLSPIPDGGRVYLVQGRIKPGLEVDYIQARTAIDATRPVTLDTTEPSFVRVEVYRESSGSSEPIVFSNPIFLMPESAQAIALPYVEGR